MSISKTCACGRCIVCVPLTELCEHENYVACCAECRGENPMSAELAQLRAEVAGLKAELQDIKEHKAMEAFFGGPGEESVNSAKLAREVLGERDALRKEVAALRALGAPSEET